MKKITMALLSTIIILSASVVNSETVNENDLHDMHMIMKFMNHGLSVALEGANMQMLGQLGQSRYLDKDAIVHGTIMINDGKGMIKEMLEGRAMRSIYAEGRFDKKVMDDLHILGDKMLEVIEEVERIHNIVLKKDAADK
jgi:hypothetical protein